MFHCTSSAVKTDLSGLCRTMTGLHELHRASTVVNMLSRSFLALKPDCTYFITPHRQLKRHYQVFPAHTQACTSFTGFFQYQIQLFRPFLTLQQASTCFPAPSRRLKRLCQVIPAHTQIARASQDLHSGENCFLDLSWHINRPARASQHLEGG